MELERFQEWREGNVPLLTVVTPTLPERASLLDDAMSSVYSQTVPVWEHLIVTAERPERLNPNHVAASRNFGAAGVATPWMAALDDDDVWLPHHVETIRPFLCPSADVVYTFPTGTNAPKVDVTGWPPRYLAARLRSGNFICGNAAVRMEAFRSVGGYGTDLDPDTRRYPSGADWDDWDLWIRLAEAGATFVCVPCETWTYRLDPEWAHASVEFYAHG